ncbi:Outer membrane lipoprotein omp16 precursor [hydrothermal vent metagenome]|uniref:Outer membrane lipoprotein omp16 n=1 Tax=hydrothermal vent metagenome TaxID=652676 RepID=A0A1W1BV76_9ZZZZ
MKLTKSLIAATVATFMLAGCYNQPGLVQDNSYERTKTGAAAGALTGALLGYNTKGHHKGQRALIGGLLGAALGGGIGYSLDQQANEIARALGTGVNNDPLAALDPNRTLIVSKTNNYVKIMFRDSMMFATDSARLQPSARYKVKKVERLLESYPQTVVGVAGFTDDRGDYEYNQRLSQKRANTVANLLSVNGRPYVKGCSFYKAIVPNNSAKNRALNRRVEVYLYANQNYMTDPCR